MIIDVMTELNNNVNEQVTLGLGKLMEEITSVFWVDSEYKLRNRLTISTAGFQEMTDIPSVYCSTVLL